MQVHVWLPTAGNPGHTSLAVGEDYISFWPEGGGATTKNDLKYRRSHPGMLVQSLQTDIRLEQYRRPITVELQGLNEAAVLDYLAGLRANTPRFQMARNNCSYVVATALEAGAGGKASFKPNAGKYGMLGRFLGGGIWTPDQVLKFARELAAKSNPV